MSEAKSKDEQTYLVVDLSGISRFIGSVTNEHVFVTKPEAILKQIDVRDRILQSSWGRPEYVFEWTRTRQQSYKGEILKELVEEFQELDKKIKKFEREFHRAPEKWINKRSKFSVVINEYMKTLNPSIHFDVKDSAESHILKCNFCRLRYCFEPDHYDLRDIVSVFHINNELNLIKERIEKIHQDYGENLRFISQEFLEFKWLTSSGRTREADFEELAKDGNQQPNN